MCHFRGAHQFDTIFSFFKTYVFAHTKVKHDLYYIKYYIIISICFTKNVKISKIQLKVKWEEL